MASPPVIPEIAKAYENDPRTLLARQALATGSSVAPVASGAYAWGDGIARALQAYLGKRQNDKQMERYGSDEQQLLELRRRRGETGLDGLPDTTAKVAAALGAPPPQANNVNPSLQLAPAPAQMPPVAAPSPVGMRTLPPMAAPTTPPITSQGQGVVFTDPLAGRGRATSGFGAARPGRSHNGLDLADASGSPVGAAAEGTVIRAWNDTKNGGGNSVLVRHPDGSVTGYAHLGDIGVRRGDTVSAGQPLGTVGSTGRSTGSHLHFTYRDPSGKRVDPSTLKFGAPTELAGGPPAAAPQLADNGVPVEPTPVAPQAQPATLSGRLRMAYQQLADANRYESSGAMEMLDKGLGEQGAFDEAAAGRRQDVANTGYQAALGRYANDRTQIRGQNFDEAQLGRQQGFEERQQTRSFAHDMERAGYDRNTALMLAQLNNDADWKRQQAQIEAARLTTEQKAEAKRLGFFNTATGAKLYEETGQRVQANANALDNLTEFENLNAKQPTGGLILGNRPELQTWANQNLQKMESLTQEMRIKLSKALPGAVSDKEGDAIMRSLPSVRTGAKANKFTAGRIRRALARANEYETLKLEAMAQGNQVPFMREWDAYRNAVSIDKDTTFDEWKSSVPRYNAQGERI